MIHHKSALRKARENWFECETKVNRRKYELTFRQKKFAWSGKVDEGVIEVWVEWKQGRYTESALFEVYESSEGLRVRNGRGASQLAKTSLEKLKNELIRIVEDNPEEMEKVLNNVK